MPALASLWLRPALGDERFGPAEYVLLVRGGLRVGDTAWLEALTRVGDDLSIVGDDSLTSLDGLAALRTLSGDLTVCDNASLCADDVDALVAQLSTFSGGTTTDDNDADLWGGRAGTRPVYPTTFPSSPCSC